MSFAPLTVMLGCPTNLVPNFDLEVMPALPKYLSSSHLSARQLFEKDYLILLLPAALIPSIWRKEEEEKAYRPTSLLSCLMPPESNKNS